LEPINLVEDSPTESFLVYEQSVEEKVRFDIREPISIYVSVKGNDIIGFSLRDSGVMGFNSKASIELTPNDFNIFKSALEKALEWDSIACQNDVDEFSKSIPFTISSNNVSWRSRSTFVDCTIKKGEKLTLEFSFYNEFSSYYLSIKSNSINASGSKETFRFSKKDMERAETELLLESITNEKIQEAIKKGRIQKIEDEARKKRTETLV
jgi:hypothetical protein